MNDLSKPNHVMKLIQYYNYVHQLKGLLDVPKTDEDTKDELVRMTLSTSFGKSFSLMFPNDNESSNRLLEFLTNELKYYTTYIEACDDKISELDEEILGISTK